MDAFVITLREGFEAALIVGLILAYLTKTGQDGDYGRGVWMGVAAAVVMSILVGLTLFLAVGELEGSAEAVFEGTAMMAAAVVLTWMVFWMRRQARTIGKHLRAQVDQAVQTGSVVALAAIAFVGVGREGIETALFLFAATKESGALLTIAGGLLGLAVAIVLGVLLYRGAIKIDLRKFFAVTGMLVILLAAWLLFNGLHELGEAGASEGFEAAAPLAALVYGVGFAWMYLRGLRTPAAQS